MAFSVCDSPFDVILSYILVNGEGILPLKMIGSKTHGIFLHLFNEIDHNSFNEGEHLGAFD